MRHGDGLSPLLLDLVLEKVIREGKMKLKGSILVEFSIHLDCLAFAYDLAILSNNRQKAVQCVENFDEIANNINIDRY